MENFIDTYNRYNLCLCYVFYAWLHIALWKTAKIGMHRSLQQPSMYKRSCKDKSLHCKWSLFKENTLHMYIWKFTSMDTLFLGTCSLSKSISKDFRWLFQQPLALCSTFVWFIRKSCFFKSNKKAPRILLVHMSPNRLLLFLNCDLRLYSNIPEGWLNLKVVVLARGRPNHWWGRILIWRPPGLPLVPSPLLLLLCL